MRTSDGGFKMDQRIIASIPEEERFMCMKVLLSEAIFRLQKMEAEAKGASPIVQASAIPGA